MGGGGRQSLSLVSKKKEKRNRKFRLSIPPPFWLQGSESNKFCICCSLNLSLYCSTGSSAAKERQKDKRQKIGKRSLLYLTQIKNYFMFLSSVCFSSRKTERGKGKKWAPPVQQSGLYGKKRGGKRFFFLFVNKGGFGWEKKGFFLPRSCLSDIIRPLKKKEREERRNVLTPFDLGAKTRRKRITECTNST